MNSRIDPNELDAYNRQSDALEPIRASGLTLPLTVVPKSGIQDAAMVLVDHALETTTRLSLFVQLHNLSAVLESAMAQTKNGAILEMTEKKQVVLGALVEQRNLPAKWDYHGDSELTRLEGEAEKIKKQIKARQTVLQNMAEETASTSTGDITTPATQVSQGATIAVSY